MSTAAVIAASAVHIDAFACLSILMLLLHAFSVILHMFGYSNCLLPVQVHICYNMCWRFVYCVSIYRLLMLVHMLLLSSASFVVPVEFVWCHDCILCYFVLNCIIHCLGLC